MTAARTLRPEYAALLSADERVLFGEAVKAGAVIVPRLLREYLEGQDVAPFQFESGYVFSEDVGNPHYEEPAALARDARSAFNARVRSGDLHPVALRIGAARAVSKVAA